MVGTAAHQKFFQPEETAPDGDWHAYREDSAIALCQQTSLRYNVDRIADSVPSGGHLCDGCNAVLSGVEPITEAIADEPDAGPAEITTGEAGPETIATPEPVEPVEATGPVETTEPVEPVETQTVTDWAVTTVTEPPEDQAPAG